MSHHTPHHSDKGAAYTGLVAGLVAVMLIVYGIVLATNKKFQGHEAAAKPAAGAPAGAGH